MSDDEDLESLLRPVSAKVQPKHKSWGTISMGTAGDKQTEDQKALRGLQTRLYFARKRAKKTP